MSKLEYLRNNLIFSKSSPEKTPEAPPKNPRSGSKGPGGKFSQFSNKNSVWTWVLFGTAILLLINVFNQSGGATSHIDYSEFKNKISQGEIKRVLISRPEAIKGFVKKESTGSPLSLSGPGEKVYIANYVEDSEFTKLMDKYDVSYTAENMTLKNLFMHWVLPFLIILLIWRFLFAKAFKMGPGAGLMSFGKNRAKLVEDDAKKVTFDDVAGVEEAKEELQEIISFLNAPQKFRDIGGKIPKGILLVGPPGTGKTLIARAVAGQAGVPFFSLSGSDFVEMFVGVGASRVRDLFAQATEKAPCIIFIDELDAIGKMRSAVSPMGGHDEREQTLNQLLVEMDGFDTRTGVIIMAATNRPEILDPALLRPGRFDRQVLVDRPDIVGREEILKVHVQGVKVSKELDLSVVAARTPGFVGADLANVVNEAALLAVRKSKKVVELEDFEEAVDRVVAGLQRKSRLINRKEKEIVAHHEVGHALATHFTRGTDPVHKISVIPRGFGALGFTLALPTEDRYLLTREELLGRIDVLLGGRVAEEVIFNEISTGASDDLQKATDIAKQMVMDYGMSSMGQRTFRTQRPNYLQGSTTSQSADYSDTTAEAIDAEIAKLLSEAYSRVTKLIGEKKNMLTEISSILQEKEVLEGEEFASMVDEFEKTGKITRPAPVDTKKVVKSEQLSDETVTEPEQASSSSDLGLNPPTELKPV